MNGTTYPVTLMLAALTALSMICLTVLGVANHDLAQVAVSYLQNLPAILAAVTGASAAVHFTTSFYLTRKALTNDAAYIATTHTAVGDGAK